MKKTIVALLFGMSVVGAFAQGQVNFNNRVLASGIDAPVFDVDGTTRLDSGFVAQLWYDNGGTWTAAGAAVPFRDAAGAGYLNTTGLDVTRVLTGVAAGSAATIQVRAWTGSFATYESAATFGSGAKIGTSPDLVVTTGGAGSPPSLPANLVGLQSFNLTLVPIPEPSVIMLGLAGAGLLWFRRKK